MYFVFDCTVAEGYAFSTPYRWVAVLGSRILSRLTRRVHDFENMTGAL
jgi:hypothetical protein